MRYPKGGDAIQPGDKVIFNGNDEIGTIKFQTPRGLWVKWQSGEESEEVPEDLTLAEHLMGWESQPAYQEGPGGL